MCSQYAQQRIETVQRVYEKHFSQDTVSKDGRKHTSKRESFVQKEDQRLIVTPRRSLAPKSLTYGLKGANGHQAINGTNNIGLELVEPAHNFDVADNFNGVVSTMDKSSIINSPLIQRNGFEYYEKTVTTTTTVTVTKKVIGPTDTAKDSSFSEPIDIGEFLRLLHYFFVMTNNK